MSWRRQNREQINRYLLGQAPEQEQLDLEKKYFADPEKLEELREAENDLVDHFVHDELSPLEKERFQTHYLSSSARQQKVAFARSLARASAGVEQPLKKAEVWWWASFPRGFRRPLLASALALAVVILAALAVWTILDARRLRGDLAAAREQEETFRREDESLRRQDESLRQRERDLEQQIADAKTQTGDLSRQLGQLREQQKELEARIGSPKSAAPAFVSFVLSPGLARSTASQTPKLVIAPGVRQLNLRVIFERGEYATYAVDLKTVEGVSVFSQRGLKARKLKNGTTLFITAPAARLAAGDYILTLSGAQSTGELQEAGRYFFRVQRALR